MSAKPPPVQPLLLSAKDAARALAVSERTLFDLTASGAVPCVRFGRRKLYSVEALRRIVDGGGMPPATQGSSGSAGEGAVRP